MHSTIGIIEAIQNSSQPSLILLYHQTADIAKIIAIIIPYVINSVSPFLIPNIVVVIPPPKTHRIC